MSVKEKVLKKNRIFFQVRNEFESFSSKFVENEKYEVAIDISEDLEEDSLLFLTFCVKWVDAFWRKDICNKLERWSG